MPSPQYLATERPSWRSAARVGGGVHSPAAPCSSPRPLPLASRAQFDETLNSLKYANRAKNIKPRGGLPIVINEQRDAPLLSELQKLQRELVSLTQRGQLPGDDPADDADDEGAGHAPADASSHAHHPPREHPYPYVGVHRT